MLLLYRRKGEKIYIGPDIVVSVERVSGSHVQLGIQAPNEVPILREELLIRNEEEGESESSVGF